jgi:DNA-binding transcriptional MerR regulator
MGNEKLTIQEVASLTGLSAHTLRYYERVGLLDPVFRTEKSGHRRYSQQNLAWIEFLGRLRTTGMPIRKMKFFAELRRAGNATVPERRELLQEHQSEVRKRAARLERDLKAIEEKVELYLEMESNNGPATGTVGETGREEPLRAGLG